MAAYHLLAAPDQAAAQPLAHELDEQNRERQRLTRETQDKARELAQDHHAHLIFAASPDFRAGVVGLAAARLSEEFYRPAIVIEQGPEESRGSCRSIPEFHITQALDQCADLLVRHGGHAAAAGFTVRNENLPLLAERLRALAAAQLDQRDLSPTLAIDCEWPLDNLSQETCQALTHLEPCGYGNPTPLLCSRHLRVAQLRAVGSDGAHLKLQLRGERYTWDAIAFRQSRHLQWLQWGEWVDVAYLLEENEWNGEKRIQLNVRDLRPSEK
jgi:single-stranded-DNA-specific exonuclease